MSTRTRSLYFSKLINSRIPVTLPFSCDYSLGIVLHVEAISKCVLSDHNLRPIKPLPQGYLDSDYRYEKRSLRRVFCYQTRGIASNISSLTIKWKLSFWQRNNNMAALISYAGFWIFKSKMQNIYRLYHTRRWWKAWIYYSSKPNNFGNYRLLNT